MIKTKLTRNKKALYKLRVFLLVINETFWPKAVKTCLNDSKGVTTLGVFLYLRVKFLST